MRTIHSPLCGIVLLAGAVLALPAGAKICVVDDVPAATVLVPYIAMPLGGGSGGGSRR